MPRKSVGSTHHPGTGTSKGSEEIQRLLERFTNAGHRRPVAYRIEAACSYDVRDLDPIREVGDRDPCVRRPALSHRAKDRPADLRLHEEASPVAMVSLRNSASAVLK
jgi:ribosomal protein S16